MFPKTILLIACLQAAVPAFAGMSLPEILSQVRAHDPVLAAARLEARMAGQMARAAGAWEAPELGIELMGLDIDRPNLAAPMQRKLSLTQELPFFGRTWLRGRLASRQAESQAFDAARLEQQELKAAKEAYYRLASAEILLKGIARVSEATREMSRVSGKRASFGQLDRMGQFMDAMLAMEDSNVEAMRPMAEQQRRAAEASLRRLTGAGADRSWGPLSLNPEEVLARPLPSLDALLSRAEAVNPDLAMMQAKVAAAETGRTLALSGWLPDLTLQGSVTEGAQGNRELGAMLGLSLPWLWFWKQSNEMGVANSALEKARLDLQAARLALREGMETAYGEAQAVQEALRITWTRTSPKATEGLDMARTGFRTTALGSSEILMAVQDYRMTTEKLADLLRQWGEASAMLEMWMGASLDEWGGKP